MLRPYPRFPFGEATCDINLSLCVPKPSSAATSCLCWTCGQMLHRTRTSRRRSSTASKAAAGHHRRRRASHGLSHRRFTRVVFQLRLRGSLREGGAGEAPVQEGWCVAPSGENTRSRVNHEQGARAKACASTQVSERNHSSSMCRRSAESQKNGGLPSKRPFNVAIGDF